MPKRTDIHKILVIGSGPIVIGQAAEFDYAGTQACLALKEEGYEVVLCNSNPATIMTDTSIADKVYMEPLTLEYIAKIVRKERPDAILPGIGGQTGLNLAMQLEKKGILAECRTELLGTKSRSIEQAEDRELFKELCLSLGEPVLPSEIACSMEEGLQAARDIGYPVVLRPAFTLGGTGGGFADSEEEFIPIMKNALALSPVSQVLIEKSVKGYKEIEYEVMRDRNDTAITICNMENMDPVGIHTGDSIVVCPSQTLTNKEYHMLRDSALKVIRALEIEGGCNVQFALDPNSFSYYLIEVNPRVSRSSALASKASGYPIARVSAKIGVGMTLDEIPLANTPASFEPALDYVVTKMPRFPFDKFTDADNSLSTQMKATGEVMSIGRTLEESLLKAVRSLETGHFHLHDPKFDPLTNEELLNYIRTGTDDRIFAIAELLRRQTTSGVICHEQETSGVICREQETSGVSCRPLENELHRQSGIDPFFLRGIRRIVEEEKALAAAPGDLEELREAKKMGFSDREIGILWDLSEEEVFSLRSKNRIMPVYKMIDTCASEFDSYVPYFYSTYETAAEQMTPEVTSNEQTTPEVEVENEVHLSDRKKVIVLGAGPIRIGQGVEFDYSTVHAVQTIQKAGYEAIIINNNPETVSTDYTCSDKLYFEPLCVEDVMNVIEMEKPDGVIVTLGGQTAINLAAPLRARGVRIIGTDCDAIDKAENRDLFEKLLETLGIPQPRGCAVTSAAEGLAAAEKVGYPVLVRPSFVLGGRAMQIVAKEADLRRYLKTAEPIDESRPVLVDHYIRGKEVEVDAVCDGERVFVPGIMELVERTGVHSGDSISVYPPYSLSAGVKKTILDYTERLGLGIGIRGLFNIQFIVDERENVYIIEVNPRSSRTVPFLSKATGYSLADIATLVSLGITLKGQGLIVRCPAEKSRYYVKVPAFSFSKLRGMDAYLSPEMKSTGEAIGYDKKLHRAVYKAMIASGMTLRNYGTVLVSVADEDKIETIPLVRRFYEMGFNIEATTLTAEYLLEAGIKTRILHKPSEHSEEMLDSIRAGYVSYVINTRAVLSGVHYGDGVALRSIAAQNNVVMLTSLDTVRMLLDVLEEVTMGISTIDAE
ncbi:MAG: carbamoyl-phosphate synthase large subunit [Lachnospiraceae bacterium]|nr:carbamoyl-phosphate synthase large subunit [Lachnospiraceae bacterium]